MKRWWLIFCLCVPLQAPESLRAQSFRELLLGMPGQGLSDPIVLEEFATDAQRRGNQTNSISTELRTNPDSLTVLPDDGRELYFSAIDAANDQIRIEICVLEDPQILQHLEAALSRGVKVRAIVDRGKYSALDAEQQNLSLYLTSAGGQLHLSNPVFPRSFPKIILIDSKLFVYGSACLDETTFIQYRDFATTDTDPAILYELERLFENDWTYSAEVGQEPPSFNPTSRISGADLMISPINSADRLVRLYQKAKWTLDVYTELLGNLTLESELFAAVKRGVRVRLIAPVQVNGATPVIQQLQTDSLKALTACGSTVLLFGFIRSLSTIAFLNQRHLLISVERRRMHSRLFSRSLRRSRPTNSSVALLRLAVCHRSNSQFGPI